MRNCNDQASLADKAFAEYRFGEGVMVTDTSGWEYVTPGHERTRKVYVETEREDDGPAPRFVLNFTARFDPATGELSEAFASDDNGQIWGSMPIISEELRSPDRREEPASALENFPFKLEFSTMNEIPEIGFSSHGYFVTDPFYDAGMTSKVDPMECWGVSHAHAKFIVDLNDGLVEAVEDALNAGCFRLQKVAGISDGGYAGVHFSDREVRRKLMEIFAEYITADINGRNIRSQDFKLTKGEIEKRILGHNLQSYDGWIAAAKALLEDAPSWTAIQDPSGLFVVKVSIGATTGVFSCPANEDPGYLYSVEDLGEFDRSAWAVESWDGCSVKDNESCLTNPVFVHLRND